VTGESAYPYARAALNVLSRLAVPAALFAGAFLVVYLGERLPLARLSAFLTHSALVGGAAVALVFRRGRALFALLTLTLAYAAQQTCLAQGLMTPAARAVYLLLTIFVPVNLALLAALPERGTINRNGAERLVVLLAEAAIIGVVVAVGGGALFDWVSGRFLPFGLGQLPHAGVLVVIAAVTAALAATIRTRSAVSAACAGAILAFVVAVHVPAANYTSSIFFLAAGLMVTIAVLHDAFRVASRDRQTGLPNRQALDDRLEALPRKYALAMVDIDRFGDFNTTRGSALGDQALKMVAARIQLAVGRGNAYRFGGEEFAVVLPRTNAAGAVSRLEALRHNVESYHLALRSPERERNTRRSRRAGGWKGSETLSLTVSIGVADNASGPVAPRAVLEEAERALYRAKEKGRNTVST
jgi:diguanylate cyclase (GGDEF)-like protein